jgi:hypothetical protein
MSRFENIVDHLIWATVSYWLLNKRSFPLFFEDIS